MSKSRSRVAVIAMSVLAVAAVSAVLLLRDQPTEATPQAGPEVHTTTVRRTDLANTRSLPGTLGFGAPRPVKGVGTGTVTALPAVGDTAVRGKALHRVDDRPVPVFFGATPLFRKIETPGTKGSDVAVVMDNLAALGYHVGIRPDDDSKAEFTPRVVEALKKWQREMGLDAVGTVEPGQVLVLQGPSRVSSVQAQPGATAGDELFSMTLMDRRVTVRTALSEAGPLSAGTAVLIARPDGKDVPAKITSVGAVVESEEGTGTAQVDVVVIPDSPDEVADLDSTPVQVKITTESRQGVLAVPVEALVALREGGYALQQPGGELRAVRTGLQSRDLVEVSGESITEGMSVVTAR